MVVRPTTPSSGPAKKRLKIEVMWLAVGTAIIMQMSSRYYPLLKKAEVAMDNDIRLAFGTVVVSHELVSDKVAS